MAELKNIPEIETQVLVVYAADKFKWAAPNWRWRGQEVQVKGIIQVYNGKNYFSLEMKWDGAKTQTGWELLGNISDNYKRYFLPGQVKVMKIYSISFNAQNQTKGVVLFNKDMNLEEIKKCLLFDYDVKI